ncbi:hypothetical protein D3C85_1799360 [compost metagenome]
MMSLEQRLLASLSQACTDSTPLMLGHYKQREQTCVIQIDHGETNNFFLGSSYPGTSRTAYRQRDGIGS